MQTIKLRYSVETDEEKETTKLAEELQNLHMISKWTLHCAFKEATQLKSFILDISRNDSEERFARMKWTTIRSTHYEKA